MTKVSLGRIALTFKKIIIIFTFTSTVKKKKDVNPWNFKYKISKPWIGGNIV